MKKNKIKSWICGDIHGWDTPLQELLDRSGFDYENDRLISMGDLCDRGPRTWEVLEILLKIKNKVLIRGNHDWWMLDFLKGKISRDDYSVWMENGGTTTVSSYLEHGYENKQAHIDLLESQVPYHVQDNICFVHGGFDRDHPIAKQTPYSLCWDRELVKKAMSAGKKKLETKDGFDMIFIGHTPTIYRQEPREGGGRKEITRPIFSGGVWNVDTGCGKKGFLTLFDLDNMTYIQSEEKY